MARERYYVVFQNDEWKIKHNDRHLESYPTQEAAIKDAVLSRPTIDFLKRHSLKFFRRDFSDR
jgi:hypothetical protein